MMKKYFYGLMMVLLIPLGVKAASVKTSLSCPSSANANSTISCNIKVTPSGFNLGGFQTKFVIAGGTFASFSASNGWTVYSSSASGISITSNNTYTSETTVGTVKFKMPGSGNMVIKFTEVVASDDNYNSYDGNGTSATIRVKSNINTLSSLSITEVNLTPAFNANTTSYTVNTDLDKITINATKTDSNASVTGTGSKTLKYGKNTFSVVVKAEDGSTKTYIIVVNRKDNRNSDSSLKSLSISSGQIKFYANTKSYNISLKEDVESFSVEGVANNSKSKVSYSPSKSIKIKQGETKTITIIVTAENESKTKYKVHASRGDSRSNDNYLKSLSITEGKIDFNKDVLNYNLEVPFNITKLSLNYVLSNSKAKIDVKGDNNLVVGNNVITLLITAENQTTRTYTLNVKRLKENEVSNTTSTTTTTTTKKVSVQNNEKNNASYNLLFFILGVFVGAILTLITLLGIKKYKDNKNAIRDID